MTYALTATPEDVQKFAARQRQCAVPPLNCNRPNLSGT